jgi:hypothetical protein
MREEPRPLALASQGVPDELCRLVDRLLAKDPAARGGDDYRSTIEALESLEDGGSGEPAEPDPISSAPTRAVSSARIVAAAAAQDEVAPLYAWLVPDEEDAPHVAILRGDELAFGASTTCPLFLPDETGEKRRVSRLHGRMLGDGERYRVSPRDDPQASRTPSIRIDGGGDLPAGAHDVEPGQRLEFPAIDVLVSGSHEKGLRLDFEGRDNERAASYQGRWYWVLMAGRVVAGSDPSCGVRLTAEDAAPDVFELTREDGRLLLRALTEGVRVAGEEARGFEVLRDGDRIEGPGFAFTLSLRETAEALWDS